LDLNSWRVAYCGAEPVRYETLRRFAARFAPCGFTEDAFYPSYGLAEATLMVTSKRRPGHPGSLLVDGRALRANRVCTAEMDGATARGLVSNGAPGDDQPLAIVDPDGGSPLPRNTIGEIWVAGPSVTAGYWNDPEASAAIFRAYLADGTGPFLRTGD